MNPFLSFFAALLSLCCLADGAPELTSVAASCRVTDDECREPRPFAITGTLLQSGREYSRIRDDTGGANLHLHGISTDGIPLFSTIRACGTVSIYRNGEREFLTTRCDLLRTNPPETPVDSTCADINSGRTDDRMVRLRGVISSATLDEVDPRSIWICLRDASGTAFITCSSSVFSERRLQSLVDAEVEISGLSRPIGGLRHHLGRHVNLDRPADVKVLKPAPEDPFLAPPLTTQGVTHRQRVNGTVIGLSTDRCFIRTTAGRIVPILTCEDPVRPLPGATVTAVGFATLDPYRIQLSEAIVRIDAQSTPLSEAFVPSTIESLFRESGRKHINTVANGTFLVLRGTSARFDDEQLVLSSGNDSVFVDLSACRGGLPPPNGSVVEVRGLCIADFECNPHSGAYPTFRRFTLLPASASDVRVISTPGWWTVRKLLYVIAALGLVLVVILIWNRIIHVVSERRGQELYAERIDHALAEQKVEERTRLAVELHDSVSQTLTGVALQLDGGEVETAKTMLASCRGELRRCLWDLRSRTFEERDMTEAVTRTIAPHLNGCAATVRFNVPRERLSESLTHAILRIIRELVVNAIRHGQAQHIKIAGEMHGSTVSFSVSDDGRGFDPATAPGPERGHFGLLGIRERIEDFNGELKIASAPNQGAKFTVTLTADDETNEC